MTRRAKKILPAGLAAYLVALTVSAQTPMPLGGMPLYFEANRGQADPSTQFLAHGLDSQFLISPTEAQIVLCKEAAGPVTVRMQFIGANPQAQIRGEAALPGKVNYLVGNDPAQWRTGVPTFAKVRVEEIYPGIGLVYYGNQQQLEYDFEVAPGTDPGAVKIRFDGVDKIAVNAQGELILALSGGEIRQPKPVIYQMTNGARREISGGYRLVNAHTLAFDVSSYDHSLPLVIDPILSYSTYFGGKYGDTAWSVKVDPNGFVYVAGETLSPQFLTNTPGAYQTNSGGTLSGDAFVAKFGNLGTNLIYFTYLGGNADDSAVDMAVDDAGHAYVTGFTASTNFPFYKALYPEIAGTNVVNNGHSFGYNADAFVAELETNGSQLVYSTYLGGSGLDNGRGIAVDAAGNAYITGRTSSTNFPTTTNAYQLHLACTNSVFNGNAFVTEISAGGSNLLYSSYFGGTNYDSSGGIAVDPAGYVYVVGSTASTNFPTTTNALFPLLNGSTNLNSTFDAFVVKFKPAFTGLVYSTYLGSSNYDVASRVTCDAAGDAYVIGSTASSFFPNTATNIIGNNLTNNLNLFFPVTTNVFLTEINSDGTAITYSAVFGGNTMDLGYGVALDPAGNIFVVGTTISTNFPVTTNNIFGFLRATNSGGSDVFVLAFSNNFSGVLYSAYLGGSANDFGYGIAVDTNGDAYVVGQTLSTNFPMLNARQTALNGTNDAFLAAIILTVPPPVITVPPTNQAVGVGSTVTFAVTATGTPPLSYQWQAAGTNLIGTNLVNGGGISGATTNVLTISDAQVTNSGNYLVIVTNYGGSVTSSVALLTVTNIATVLTLQPTNQTVGVGSTVTFSVDGTAQPPFFLQWLKDGIDLTNGTNISGSIISGATNATLRISNAQTNDDGAYWLVVSNVWGSLASSNAVLTVVSFPTITVPPTNRTVGLGSTVTFAVTAVGMTPLSYRWQVNGTDLVNGERIGGATNFALTITNAQTSDDGGYSVIVTNIVGSVTSSPPAVLTVLSSPLFGNIMAAGGTNGGFILSGVGGTNNGTYNVLTSSNLLTPLGSWTPIATNQFDNLGGFIFTNAAQTNAPQLFYILKLP